MTLCMRSIAVILPVVTTVGISVAAFAEDAPLNPAGAEDPALRVQPVLNYNATEVTPSLWDNPRNRHYTYANFEKVHPYPAIISRGTGSPHVLPVAAEGWRYVEDFRIKPWKEAEEMNLSRYL